MTNLVRHLKGLVDHPLLNDFAFLPFGLSISCAYIDPPPVFSKPRTLSQPTSGQVHHQVGVSTLYPLSPTLHLSSPSPEPHNSQILHTSLRWSHSNCSWHGKTPADLGVYYMNQWRQGIMAFEPGRLRFFFVSPGLRDEFLLAEERGSRALDWQNQLQLSRISMVWETNEASLSIGSGGSLGFHRVAARSGETSPHPTGDVPAIHLPSPPETASRL